MMALTPVTPADGRRPSAMGGLTGDRRPSLTGESGGRATEAQWPSGGRASPTSSGGRRSRGSSATGGRAWWASSRGGGGRRPSLSDRRPSLSERRPSLSGSISPRSPALSEADAAAGEHGRLVRHLLSCLRGYEAQEDGGCFMLAFHDAAPALRFGALLQAAVAAPPSLAIVPRGLAHPMADAPAAPATTPPPTAGGAAGGAVGVSSRAGV